MDHSDGDERLTEDNDPRLPDVGTVITVWRGDDGLTKTLKDLLDRKLMWKERPYCPLGTPQRLLPSPLLSDAQGLQLWAAITRLSTYYQMSGEIELLQHHGHEIASCVPLNAVILDLGSGDVRKVQPLLDTLEHKKKEVWYFALDLAKEPLQHGIETLARLYRFVKCFGLWGTFDDGLAWLNAQQFDRPRLVLSLGSIFGNDHFNDAVELLSSWKIQAFRGKADTMLLTMDATSDLQTVWQSYHDPHGLFERFIRNGYQYTNRILGNDWYHDEDWDLIGVMQEEPIMHRFVLRAKKDVTYVPRNLVLPKGSEIDCYEGFKYPPEIMRKQFSLAGFEEVACWKAPNRQIYQYLLAPGKVPQSTPAWPF